MNRRQCGRLLPLLAVFVCSLAQASTRPAFDLEGSTWTSTHIVLAGKVDGVFSVLESWRGDLKPGEPLRDLAGVADEGSRAVTADSRVVLFLRKRVPVANELAWAPAGRSSQKLATVWLDEGTAFALWAPNAERVSVVGDWCNWDGRQFPMRRLGGSGLWELFVPGVGANALYKFELRTREGALRLKADPMGFKMQQAPLTASTFRR